MIIRRANADLLFITQHDHADLAARIVDAWRADDVADRPTRARLREATRQHDAGWVPIDAAPEIDAATGAPLDFMTVSAATKQQAWPRAIEALARRDPYAAALVAHHGATVYRRYEQTPEWTAFFPDLEGQRDALLATQAIAFDAFLRDYAILTVADLASLAFCTAATEPASREGYQVTRHPDRDRPGFDHLDGDSRDPERAHRDGSAHDADDRAIRAGWIEIMPDPFGGARVPLQIAARRLPARRYASAADLRAALARAPIVSIEGAASGPRGAR